MSNFWEEFGFIPPELLYKCDGIVSAFHKARGGGQDFVSASLLFSAGSPNLTRMAHNIVAIGKLIPLLVGVSAIVLATSLLTNIWWLLLAILPIGAVIYLSRMIKISLIQHRAVILAVETLATEVAGWGSFSRLRVRRLRRSERMRYSLRQIVKIFSLATSLATGLAL